MVAGLLAEVGLRAVAALPSPSQQRAAMSAGSVTMALGLAGPRVLAAAEVSRSCETLSLCWHNDGWGCSSRNVMMPRRDRSDCKPAANDAHSIVRAAAPSVTLRCLLCADSRSV